MAGCADPIASRARLAHRARRGLLVATVGCGVLGLQSLPTAAAAKDRPAASPTPSVETTASERRAERAAAKAEAPAPAPAPAAAPAPVEAPPPSSAHGRRGQPGAHVPPSPPAPPLPGTGAGPASHGADHPISAAHARRREERRAQATGSPSVASAPEAGESTSAANATELARGQKKAKKEKEKEKEKEKTKAKEKENRKEKGKKTTVPPAEEAGNEAGEESSRGATIGGKGTLGLAEPAQPTAVAASVSAPVAAAPTPAGGTGTASISSLAATVEAQPGSGGLAARSARAAHGAGKKSRQGTLASTATASATPLVALSPAAASTAARRGHAVAKHARKAASQPAIVKTITRIVGVVPTPIRILILALVALALALGVRSLFNGVRTRRLVRQRGELLEDVGALQAALLPVPPQRLGPVGTSVAYRPADGPGAGGDFYDVFALEDGRIAVIVGDVSGHGREALPHTALVRFTVRAYLEAGLTPAKALQTAGNVLERQLAGSFATVVAAIYHPRERTLTFASAGHPPPVVLGAMTTADAAQAITPVTSCSAPPVGAGIRTGTRETVVSVPGPARLCFHTDGVTEARIAGELFGAERLAKLVADLGSEDDASTLLDRVAEQSDARPDDMAACVLRVQDGAGAPSIVFEQLELDGDAAANPRAERFLRDCGVAPTEAELLMRSARARLEHADTVLLELRLGGGEPVVTLHDENAVHPVALAAASAS
jgi:Stage II sporulation protein E (SpoIIE)